MFFAPVFRSLTTTDVGGNGIGQKLVGLQTIAGGYVLGGSWSAFSWSAADMPRQYAAQIKRRVLPLIGSNSEQVAFPPLVPPAMNAMQVSLSGLNTGAEKAPRGEFYAQRRQRPRPLWFAIVGITRDSAGAALGSCAVKLYRFSDDTVAASQTSDASGNFTFWVPDSTTNYYTRAYKTGAPDVAGTSLNTLVGI